MRYGDDDQESRNVEDRRGQGGGIFGGGGMFGGGRRGRRINIPMGGGRSMGGGGFSFTTLLIIGAVMLFMGINPLDILTGGGSRAPQAPQLDPGNSRHVNAPSRPATQRNNPFEIPGMPGAERNAAPRRSATPGRASTGDDWGVFTKRVLKDTEDVWKKAFARFGKTYREPTLVLYSGRTSTGCGPGQAAMGPFYCPLDEKIYIDLSFYDELNRKFRAPGDFAQAFVLSHEVGHHVQKLLGIAGKVQSLKMRIGKRKANALQVRMELQADCLAGVWASKVQNSKQRLETGDIEEGLRAARAIGDDMIQRRTMGRVVPHAFTHGSSAQRERWFRRGLQTGQMKECDTFNASQL